MQFTFGEEETPVDYNFVTDRLLSATFGGSSFAAGHPEVFELWFSNGHTLRIISEGHKGVRVNLVPPATQARKK
jgi:hypothetical protein